MIKTLLKPFLKKHLGLFISMVFVSTLALSLLVAFATAITNLIRDYDIYKKEYGAPDLVVTTDMVTKDDYSVIENVEGIEKSEYRISFDTFLKKADGRTITSRILSYNANEEKIFKRYISESTDYSSNKLNVSITSKFANNNNFKLGDSITFSVLSLPIEAYISEIVETPEAIYVRASNYLLSDNTDFGFIYANEEELNKAISRFANDMARELIENEVFKELYGEAKEYFESEIFEVANLVDEEKFASKFTNQILVKVKDGYDKQIVLDNIVYKLKESDLSVKDSYLGKDSIYQIYMENCIKQIRVGAIFLPLFFFIVTLIIIVLFLNQIIRGMTNKIGIMMSVGISPKEITGLFSIYTLLMTIISSILGIALAIGLSNYMGTIFKNVYTIPIISSDISPLWTFVAIIILVLIGQLAVLLCAKQIYKITPKDAMTSNGSKKKILPIWFNNSIAKLPMTMKLGVNSIAQNLRRFIVSVFSIFAAVIMVLLALTFSVSKDEIVIQTFDKRMTFDIQIYETTKVDNKYLDKLKANENIIKAEECYFTYLKISNGDQSFMMETLALDTDSSLMYIPSDDNRIYVENTGIILTESDAKRLNVNIGDNVTINDMDVKVTGLSTQYFHMTEYMSKEQLKVLSDDYVTSYLVDIKDDAEKEVLNFLADSEVKGLNVFTKSLRKDLNSIFKSIDTMIWIMIGFSLGMGFIILAIMSLNALQEQKRQVSIMRAVGFRMKDISNFWVLHSVLEFVLGILLAVPAGLLIAKILFSLISTETQVYPFIVSWSKILYSTLFIIGVLIATHIISMVTVKRWNLADNTRTRE